MSKRDKIEYVLFDMDGLLIDSEKVYTEVTNTILAKYGKEMTWNIKAGLMGKPFYKNGQAMRNSAALLPNLVNNGIRVLGYAGATDGVCNHTGVELWMSRLEHAYHEEFSHTLNHPWRTIKSGSHVGNVRSAGSGAGNVTFVRVFEGGHVVSYDQPEATQDMMLRWIENKPFY